MRGCIRETDIAARLGGDEFAVVQTPINGPAETTSLAARLIETGSAPYQLDGHQIMVGASVGIAIAPADGTEPDQLVKNADTALYRCKADGGNTYRFFEPEMDARMQERRALELDLRKALANGEFILNYQPLVNLKTGKISSCEALIRWHQPERGLEVTELVLMQDTNAAHALFHRLKDIGVSIAMDDSGPGTRHSAICAVFHSIRSRSISRSFVTSQRIRIAWQSFAP